MGGSSGLAVWGSVLCHQVALPRVCLGWEWLLPQQVCSLRSLGMWAFAHLIQLHALIKAMNAKAMTQTGLSVVLSADTVLGLSLCEEMLNCIAGLQRMKSRWQECSPFLAGA